MGREYLIVDDGSSKADQAIMRARFPNCRFISKAAGEEGHPKSIKQILEQHGRQLSLILRPLSWVLSTYFQSTCHFQLNLFLGASQLVPVHFQPISLRFSCNPSMLLICAVFSAAAVEASHRLPLALCLSHTATLCYVDSGHCSQDSSVAVLGGRLVSANPNTTDFTSTGSVNS